jgi:hypothetical protein
VPGLNQALTPHDIIPPTGKTLAATKVPSCSQSESRDGLIRCIAAKRRARYQ